jgi:tRNA A-37 threonylcarbamoyl transferase component Bud32
MNYKPLIIQERIGQQRIQWKNDGFDYKSLLNRFLANEISSQRLTTGSRFRTVHKVEFAGRQFVIKHDTKQDFRLEKRLFFLVAGTMYHRLIWLTAKAIQKGCPVVQDIYLVSEKMSGRFCQDAYIIAEYVPGQCFIKESYEEGQPIIFFRPGENLTLIAEALGILHKYGLASNDAVISNFILTTSKKIKIIDLCPNTPIFISKANDIIKMRRSYRTNIPINNLLLKILTSVISWRYRLQKRLRVWRKRLPPPPPTKIWEDLPLSNNNDVDVTSNSINQGFSIELTPEEKSNSSETSQILDGSNDINKN